MYKKLFEFDVRQAIKTLLFLIFGVLPMYLFGWLVSTINLHPNVVSVLQSDAAYRVVLYWNGGTKWLLVWGTLTGVGTALCTIEWAVRHIFKTKRLALITMLRSGLTFTLKSYMAASAYIVGFASVDPRLAVVCFLTLVSLAWWSVHMLQVSDS